MTQQQKNIGRWILRLVAAVIMLQTLFFKFSAAPESVYIFSELGMEPWGRIATGVLELLASVLILIPASTSLGALLGAGLMAGAVSFHLTKLGIAVQDDGGQLFAYALIVLFCCVALLVIYKKQLLQFISKPFKKAI
ncbi:DoxX family protein [Foetidibacter luteolus]|uniref:DoxX family protein n=1 Tax=Foetidibacter luteolus TaxID=2608880 RepID=UPI00129AA970|nr:DoxX family protein [Foetidibacter luteolus]